MQVTRKLEGVDRRVAFETPCPLSDAGKSKRQGNRGGASGLGTSMNRREILDS